MKRFVLYVAIVGCSCVAPHEYSSDNPTTRAHQTASLNGFDNTVAGQQLDAFLGPRTGWILTEDSLLVTGGTSEDGEAVNLGGRAAALSSDGYYLTAAHVVDGANPVMVLPPNVQFTRGTQAVFNGQPCIFSSGRVVEVFHPDDVALVKFGHTSPAYFQKSIDADEIQAETILYVAATDGFVIGNASGNGPFKARGKVARVENRADGVATVYTSIPVRGGMSGTPSVDTHGNLVGILTTGRVSYVSHRTLESEFVSIPISRVVSAIERDRQSPR